MPKRTFDQTKALSSVTVAAPVNIAVIKYWGKRDEQLILPINSSISATLQLDDLAATTTVTIYPKGGDYTQDSLQLNGTSVPLSARMERILAAARAAAPAPLAAGTLVVSSANNFPTAAGLASSAAGLAAFAFGVCSALQCGFTPQQVSGLARMGSGSAVRSLFGGFVAWDMGSAADGSDSVARPIVAEDHWPEIRILICVVSDKKKETSSTSGMKESVATSELLAHRAATIVPKRMAAMEEAIRKRDFDSFAKITMQDSNQFHATCLDTYPPIFYMNDTSKRIVQLVHEYNTQAGEIRVAYTFDAGPNAVLYTLDKHMAEVEALVRQHVPPSDPECTPTPEVVKATEESKVLPKVWPGSEPLKHGVQRFIRTSVGGAPRLLDQFSAV